MSEDPAEVEESERKPTEAADVDGTAADETTADEVDAEADEGGDDAGPEAGAADGESPADLADRVAEYDEDLAAEVRELRDRSEELDAALADRDGRIERLEEKVKRSRADFKNYKQRVKRQQEEIRERATEDLVERVTKVRDNLLRALDQDEGADIRPGVETTLEEFDRVLAEENVEFIEPEPGDEVDPERHEVMLRVESDQPEGTVVDVYQPGYEMADKVIRAAQVTVSDGE